MRSTVIPATSRVNPFVGRAKPAPSPAASGAKAGNDGVTPGIPAPQLALRSARDLSVPFGVGAAVTVFLVIQGRIDRRDPKLVDAPVGPEDDLVEFA